MKDKLYWSVHNKLNTITFKVKAICYSLHTKFERKKQVAPLNIIIAKKALWFTFLSAIPIAILTVIDGCIFATANVELSSTLIMSGVGVAGIFLGLYCASITSIYATKYSNAPSSIASLFENDLLTNSSISHICSYILFSILLIFSKLIGFNHGVVSAVAFFLFTIWVIISFAILGNKRQHLSDTYGLAGIVRTNIHKLAKSAAVSGLFSNNINFQAHYQKVCENQIEVLHDIIIYNIGDPSNRNEAMLKFAALNNGILSAYWMLKPTIPFSSKWYKDKYEYPKWHLASDAEISLALNTGTNIQPKLIKDEYWLEDAIFDINDLVLSRLIDTKDWENIYLYCSDLSNLAKPAVFGGSAKYYSEYMNKTITLLMQLYTSQLDSESDERHGLIDAICMLFISTTIAINEYMHVINWDKYISEMLKARVYHDVDLKTNPFANNENIKRIFSSVYAEYMLERKRITPDWLIAQMLAKNIYDYVEELVQTLDDVTNNIPFNIGKKLHENKAFFDAMLIFSRMTELKSKSSVSIGKLEALISFLKDKHFEKTYLWANSSYEALITNSNAITKELPSYWAKCAVYFSLENWDDNDKFPDILGQCYNYLCNYLVQSIANSDYETFSLNYVNLNRVMLIYREFAKKDAAKIKESHKQRYALNLITKPLIDYSAISGYAYLWGEIVEPKWKVLVSDTLQRDVEAQGENAENFYTAWVELCTLAEQSLPSPSLMSTNWENLIGHAIRDNKLLEYKVGRFGWDGINTDSKLIKTFLGRSPDFIFNKDVFEIFLIMCVNKHLPADKQYIGHRKWEEDLDNDIEK